MWTKSYTFKCQGQLYIINDNRSQKGKKNVVVVHDMDNIAHNVG